MIYAFDSNVFDSFTLVIMLIMLRFKSSVVFGIHALLDKSLRLLQLPKHLSNLTANGCSETFDCIH